MAARVIALLLAVWVNPCHPLYASGPAEGAPLIEGEGRFIIERDLLFLPSFPSRWGEEPLNRYFKSAIEGRRYIFFYGDLFAKLSAFYSLQSIFDITSGLPDNDVDRVIEMVGSAGALAVEKGILEMVRRDEVLSFIEGRMRWLISPNIELRQGRRGGNVKLYVNKGGYFQRRDVSSLILHGTGSQKGRSIKTGFDLKGIDFYTYDEEERMELTDIVTIHSFLLLKGLLADNFQLDYYPLRSSWRALARYFILRNLYLAGVVRSREDESEFEFAELNITRTIMKEWKTQIQLYGRYRLLPPGHPSQRGGDVEIRYGIRLLTVQGGETPFP